MEGLSFHPDENFTNYITLETEEPTYSVEEATLRNRLMSECFTVCEKSTDIYSIMLE
ncbi:MAG: hypothetical protein IPI60_00335 [Saprospiraceae bacterium]|nr:hypothetical protein [Saprospiraceae bacterium]